MSKSFRDWPYFDHYLRQYPDPDQIEAQGRSVLYRSLNVGRVVAAVGSGVSMNYGNITWSQLADLSSRYVKARLDVTLQFLEKSNSNDECSHNRANDYTFESHRNELKAFRDRLVALGIFNDADDRRGATFATSAIQLCEALDRRVEEISENARVSFPNPLTENLRRKIAYWVKDASGAIDASHLHVAANLKAVSGIQASLSSARSLTHASLLNAKSLLFSTLRDSIYKKENFLESLVDFIDEISKDDYIAPFYECGPRILLKQDLGQGEGNYQSAPTLGPLEIIFKHLGIRRYVTTNYDLNIDRMLEKQGYADTNTEGGRKAEPFGGPSRVLLFRTSDPADLIDFSIFDKTGRVDALHLHGRAEGNANLVLTEADYQTLYSAEGATRELADDALSILFNSNPILFVGVGMTEDDTLSPLRRFAAQNSGHRERPAIALMPCGGTEQDDHKRKIELFLRYRVHAIHFGHAKLPGSTESIRWLSGIGNLLNAGHEYCNNVRNLYGRGKKTDDRRTRKHNLDPFTKSLRAKIEDPSGIGNLFVSAPPGSPKKAERPEVLDGVAVDNLERYLGGMLSRTLSALTVYRSALGCLIDIAETRRNRNQDHSYILSLTFFLDCWADGLRTMATGLCLNASLLALHEGWQNWKSEWRTMPVPRSTGGSFRTVFNSTLNAASANHNITKIERHPSALHPGDSSSTGAGSTIDVPLGDRFFHGAPSQSYATFYQALRERGEKRPWKKNDSRRIFACISPRGTGKGHFFEALRDPYRLKQLTALLNPDAKANDTFAFAFINLSHGHEVAAAFDRITNWLVMQTYPMFSEIPEIVTQSFQISRSLRKNRTARLHKILDVYKTRCSLAQGRLTIVLNGFNVLFDTQGNAKNAQLHRLVTTLLGSNSATAPLDVLLVSDSVSFPFRKRAAKEPTSAQWPVQPSIKFQKLVRNDASARGMERIDAVLASMGLEFEPAEQGSAPGLDDTDAPQNGDAYVHVIREARAPALVAAFFPLAGLLRSAEIAGRLEEIRVDAASLRLGMRKKLLKNQRNFDDGKSVKDIGGTLTAFRKMAQTRGEFDGLTANRWSALPAGHALPPEVSSWTRLFRVMGSNRFLFTLVLAATEAAAFEAVSPRTPSDRSANLASYSISRAMAFIRLVENTVANRPDSAKAEAIIGLVLANYKECHDRRRGIEPDAHLPYDPNASRGWLMPLLEEIKGPLGWRLQLKVIRICALVGQPVEASVIAKNPDVISLARQIEQAAAPGKIRIDDKQLLTLVNCILDLLVHRCMLFRLAPVGDIDGAESHLPLDPNNPMAIGYRAIARCYAKLMAPEQLAKTGQIPWRFTVHRLIQRSVFRKMNAPPVEYSQVDQYTLSMFTSQPSDVPRPSAEAIAEITEYVARLTELPQSPGEALRNWSPPASRERDSLPSREDLRAALGLLKSIYSASVISRFNDMDDRAISPISGCGYFEDHRRRLRWLLRQATVISKVAVDVKLRPYDRADYDTGHSNIPDTSTSPVFAEEIVWLFNESGLMSLIEGRLNDATALFDQALSAAQRVEPEHDSGALWTRIHLNKAYVDIERGNSRVARTYLKRIVAQKDEHPVARLCAIGFLGLTDHLAGEYQQAKDKYETAIKGLVSLERSRSAAIFSRHLADLYRVSGEKFRTLSDQTFQQALALAAHGGHEDVRQIILLARTRLAIDGLSGDPHQKIQKDIESVENYARKMGMPRLTSEAAFNRSKLLLSLGETRHAARLARVSLEIATENDMRLRQISSLLLMSKIYEARDQEKLSRPILQRALQLAEDAEYYNVRGLIARSLAHLS
jgi:tetratricopeptide (TPR) repeat protein